MLTIAQQQEVKKQDFTHYYPKYDSELLIIKKYGDGYVVALPNHLEVSLNETAMDLLEQCEGTLSIYEILQSICKKYDANEDVLATDFLNVLYDAYSAGMLKWIDGRNIFLDVYRKDTEDGKQYAITEHSKIMENLRRFEDKAVYSSLYKKTVRYSASKIEEANHNFGTLYFDCSENGIVYCMIGITPIIDYSNHDTLLFYQIDYLYVNDNVAFSPDDFDEFLRWTVSFNNFDEKEIVFELVSTADICELLEKFAFFIEGTIASDTYFGKLVTINKKGEYRI